MDREFVAAGSHSFWSLCIGYQIIQGQSSQKQNKKARVDYKELLSEADFAHYAALRELRKQQAEQDGVPVFAVFTNEQLAEMVTRRVNSASELSSIEGVGESKLSRYGSAFLQALNQFWSDSHA